MPNVLRNGDRETLYGRKGHHARFGAFAPPVRHPRASATRQKLFVSLSSSADGRNRSRGVARIKPRSAHSGPCALVLPPFNTYPRRRRPTATSAPRPTITIVPGSGTGTGFSLKMMLLTLPLELLNVISTIERASPVDNTISGSALM